MSAVHAPAIARAIAAIKEHDRFRPEPPAEPEDYELWGKKFAKLLVRGHTFSYHES
jgi:hypothetical protein